MSNKARLGRGLDALLGNSAAALQDSVAAPDAGVAGDIFKELPIEFLQRGQYQPRGEMEETSLDELAASIEAQGIIQPILVRALKKVDKYEIIAGERRWRAAQKAGLDKVPVIVRDIPDEAAIAVALIENIQRENLSALEEARGIQRLLDEFGLTHQQAAEAIGRSRTAVTNLLRLLSLNHSVQNMLEKKRFEMGHARALLSLPKSDQAKVAREIIHGSLSVRQAERLVKRHLEHEPRTDEVSQPDPDTLRLQELLSSRLGADVLIQSRGQKGKVVIQYHSLDELDGIVAKIND